MPEQALIDPATGFQIERSSGYLVHPGTGYLIEPGTGNLVDGRTWLYTDLHWDPLTGEVTSIFEPEESPSPTPSPTTNAANSPQATPAATPAPSPSPTETDLPATRASESDGINWSTHWITRTLVMLLLVGAGIVYYVKLRGPGQNHVNG